MRASRILATRPERATIALADLCQERKVEDLLVAPPRRPYFTPQRDSFFEPPPALSVPLVIRDPRQNDSGPPINDSPRSSSPSPLLEHPSPSPSTSNDTPPATTPLITPPPPPPPYIQTLPPPPHIASHTHMLPKRSKWTSPPPEDASFDDRAVYESQLDRSLELGTRRSGGYSSTFGSATGEINNLEEEQGQQEEEDASSSSLFLREREHRSLGERELLGQAYVGLEFTRDLVNHLFFFF